MAIYTYQKLYFSPDENEDLLILRDGEVFGSAFRRYNAVKAVEKLNGGAHPYDISELRIMDVIERKRAHTVTNGTI